MMNAFTIDLEDWYCPHTLRRMLDIREWERCEPRVEQSTRAILELLAHYRVEGTFFVLGWIAERHPDLVRAIAAAGHEIATHGYSHRLLTEMTPAEFERDLERALEATERVAGRRVLGFRAPAFTVTRRTRWALEIVNRFGLRYDSSIYPIGAHPDYGIADAPLAVHPVTGSLVEVPLSCAEFAGRRIPCSGGGYFRHLPYRATRWLMDRCNSQGRPVIFYLHPWELDPGQPRMPVGHINRFRLYHNLEGTLCKLENLLRDYQFTSIRKLIGLQ